MEREVRCSAHSQTTVPARIEDAPDTKRARLSATPAVEYVPSKDSRLTVV
jgi:hypothetical protein